GCGSGSFPSRRSSPPWRAADRRPGPAETAPGAPTAPARTLVAAVKVEPATIAARPPQETAGVGLYFSDRVFNANLVLLDVRGVPMSYLAESVPRLGSDE